MHKFYKEMSRCRFCKARFEVVADEGTRHKSRTYCPACRKKHFSGKNKPSY